MKLMTDNHCQAIRGGYGDSGGVHNGVNPNVVKRVLDAEGGVPRYHPWDRSPLWGKGLETVGELPASHLGIYGYRAAYPSFKVNSAAVR